MKRMSGAILSAAALISLLAPPAGAQTRVGVTSVSVGDPRGKPPTQAERVLHVGIDVQANEVVTTGADDRAHLLFLDGSSLTVGPQARLTIDRFVYDPNARAGELAISASQGVLRYVGGKISKTNPVMINTPSATLTIRGGIMIASVTPTTTVAMFAFGNELRVTANGQSQVITRPGWQVTTVNGYAPGAPVPTPPGSLQAEIGQLEASRGQGSTTAPDQTAVSSGFADHNSGRGASVGGRALADPSLGGAATNAISNAGAATQRPTLPYMPPSQIYSP